MEPEEKQQTEQEKQSLAEVVEHIRRFQRLRNLERMNDPYGRAYGMQGKTVGEILQEIGEMKRLRTGVDHPSLMDWYQKYLGR